MNETNPAGQEKLPWYFRSSYIVIAFLCVGPLALPMVWFHPKMSNGKKIFWTAVTLVLSYFMFVATLESMKKLEELYKQLKSTMP